MKTIKLTGTDAIRITRDGDTHTNTTIVDKAPKHILNKAHRDAWQLIPTRHDGTFNTQFAAAFINDVTIKDCTATSKGKLQIVFCSDGGVTNATIKDNIFDTNGKHFISLPIFSGHIENNRDSNGNLVPIQLFPLRIGGNADGSHNVFILTFSCGLRYAPANQIVADDTLDHVTDYRFGAHRNAGDVYLYDFDLLEYTKQIATRQYTANEMRALALHYGSTKEHNMKMSAAGVQRLMLSENVSYDIYLDQAGLPTIGWGHCLTQSEINSGKIVLYDNSIIDIRTKGISPQQAQALLESDLVPRERAVTKLIDVPLEQHQFDALVHWVFNVGEGAMGTSTLREKLNLGQYHEVPGQLRRWNRVTINGEKQISQGLINRREVEADMWDNDYSRERTDVPVIIQPDYQPLPTAQDGMTIDEVYRKLDMRMTEKEVDTYQREVEANSKPPYQSKILGIVVGAVITYTANKYGWDVPPAVQSTIQDFIVGGSAVGIAAARLWFTDKVLR